MGKNKYLPIGFPIGKKYKIVDILGEDDFEILYLVRDINREKSFFVIKELFLETFSSREKYAVYNIPEAQGVFQKRKKEIILEIDEPKKINKSLQLKTYGYIEENNTIYTIMEFNHNANLADYLQFQPKEQKALPLIEEIILNSQKTKKSPLLLQILLGLLTLGALAFYGYKLFQDNKTDTISDPFSHEIVTKHPPLVERNHSKEKPTELLTQEPIEEINQSIEQEIISKKEPITIPSSVAIETNDSMDIIDENISNTLEENKTLEEKSLSVIEEKTEPFEESSVKKFLDNFIALSATGSVDEILINYDVFVKRYFKLKNPSHLQIKRAIEKYNKKWKNREFSIEDFKIIKVYKKENHDYCDVQTTTKWRVSNKSGRKLSGISRGVMTLKNTKSGYKVTSIYGVKVGWVLFTPASIK